jgi:hypothetical protein
MNMTHNGKIGRLPKSIQTELNRRLRNGEKGQALAAWLNSLPAVQAVLAAEFHGGKPIRQQNLSQWRKRGYLNWLRQQEALEITQELASLPRRNEVKAGAFNSPSSVALAKQDQPSPLTGQMAGWVTARYLLAIRKLVEQDAAGEPHLRTLREFLHDVVAVRRGDHRAARLKIEQDRLDRQQHKTEPPGIEAGKTS